MTLRKPSAGFWITVALVMVLVGYPLSLGPYCWAYTQFPQHDLWSTSNQFYYPILRAWSDGPEPISGSIGWYANLCTAFPIRAEEDTDGSFLLMRNR